jgi:invasion protein IalB
MIRHLAIAMTLVVSGAVPALAQQQQRGAGQMPAPVERSGLSSGWVKVCAGPNCVTSYETVGEDGAPLASIQLQNVETEQRRRLVIGVPLGVWIDDGIQVRIGTSAPVTVPFGTCLVNGCFGSMPVSAAQLAAMRRAETLSLVVRNPDMTGVNVVVPLQPLGSTLDGAAISPEQLQQLQQAFIAEVRRRAQARAQAPQPTTPGPQVPAAAAPAQRR